MDGIFCAVLSQNPTFLTKQNKTKKKKKKKKKNINNYAITNVKSGGEFFKVVDSRAHLNYIILIKSLLLLSII